MQVDLLNYEEWLAWIGLVNYLKPIAVFINHVYTSCKWTKNNLEKCKFFKDETKKVFMLASN